MPAFDVNPSPERARELKTWVSEDAGPKATIEALMSVLPYFRIAAPRAREILGVGWSSGLCRNGAPWGAASA